MELAEKLERIGKKIKLTRIAKGIRQYDAAKALGISQAHLSNIERGRNSFTLETLFKLSELLECPVGEFFRDADKKDTGEKPELTAEEMQVMMKLFKKMMK